MKFEKNKYEFNVGTRFYKIQSGNKRRDPVTGEERIWPSLVVVFAEEFREGPISLDVDRAVNSHIGKLANGGLISGEGNIEKERKALRKRVTEFIRNHEDYRSRKIIDYVDPQIRERDELAQRMRDLGYEVTPELLDEIKITGEVNDEGNNKNGSSRPSV